MSEEDLFKKPVRVVPSINILFPQFDRPVTYSLITEDYILLATDLHKSVADRFASLHNEAL